MSACISKHGEYSEHQPGDWCEWCGAFNEDAVIERAENAELLLREFLSLARDFQENGNSRPLGDPTAGVWHKAARAMLDLLAEA